MLTKICSRCRAVVPINHECPHYYDSNKEYNRRYDKETDGFYQSKAWRLLQKAVSARANYLDEYLLFYEKKAVPARIAHHIIPYEDNRSLSLNSKNIIYVSDKTHSMIHKAYSADDKSKKLMQAKLAKVRMLDD